MYLHLFSFKVFRTVVEKGSISKAAEELFLTQPAVSLQIKTLEEFYNTKLFNRTPKGLVINRQGEILYRHARELNHLYERMNEEISGQTRKNTQYILKLGASTFAGTCLIPKILPNFKVIYSNIQIHTHVSKIPEIITGLLDDKLDVAVICAAVNKDGLQYERIFSQSLSLVAAAGHPRTSTKTSLQELKGEKLVLPEATCEIRKIWMRFLETHKVKLEDFEIVSISSSISATKSAVKEGMGLAVLPACMIEEELKSKKLQKIDIKEGDVHLPSYLAFRPASLRRTDVYCFYKFMKGLSASLATSSEEQLEQKQKVIKRNYQVTSQCS
jgi:DNA-binding transcriptional LysR family regulator